MYPPRALVPRARVIPVATLPLALPAAAPGLPSPPREADARPR